MRARWSIEAELADPTKLVMQVGLIRFDRADGLDPRAHPEPDGTHMAKPSHSGRLTDRELADLLGGGVISACGRRGVGFSDFGPVTAVTCLDCAAELAADMINKSSLG